ncbi:heat-inducible transcriptional repressor HrcA [Mesoterricola sediminis]|uniref:heat-inducible transcriptional repressor HrcA n=1 Tax=Mesoterricola sediminis TaxID=2927980 RepID=UPI001FB009AE|nr:heat-inducible transcriptional repressor HrcA [Mesoterricola sediminis]
MTLNLSPRSESVLKTLIETYLVEGEPVGSRVLSKRIPGAYSSATIRNVLADLEDEALLDQPHTSAGRIPTEKAYRYYVDHWVQPIQPDPVEAARLSEALGGLDGREGDAAWLRNAARVLSEAMKGICVALPLHLSRSRLVRLEFIPLGGGHPPDRLVALWVGTGGEVEHQLLANPWGLRAETLIELGNFATAHFHGLTLPELKARLITDLEGKATDAEMLARRLNDLASCMSPQPEGSLVVAGLGELGKFPEFLDPGRFRGLVEIFEQHERLAHLLNAFAEAATQEVQLLLGSENPFLPDLPLATALRTVTVRGGPQVTFALMGPLRLDYRKVAGGLAGWPAPLGRGNSGNV